MRRMESTGRGGEGGERKKEKKGRKNGREERERRRQKHGTKGAREPVGGGGVLRATREVEGWRGEAEERRAGKRRGHKGARARARAKRRFLAVAVVVAVVVRGASAVHDDARGRREKGEKRK